MLLVSGTALVLACSSGSRNEPALEEKCAALEEFCEAAPAARDDLSDCRDIGRRGLRDAEHQDQCFVAYERCIDECRFFAARAPEDEPDAGADAGN